MLRVFLIALWLIPLHIRVVRADLPSKGCSSTAQTQVSEGAMTCKSCQATSNAKVQYQKQRCVNGKWLDVGFCSLDLNECKASATRKWPRGK